MAVVQTILWFILALVVLVAVHEFGHFYVARRCGVRVLRFSIGFGKVLFSRQDRHGTEFAISAIPLGGYVKMLDEREGDVPADQLHLSFTQKSVWQRMAIVVAGPVANFILAIALYWALLLGGEWGVAPIIGTVESGSIAAHAGLDAGQEIISVDDELTPTRQALYQQLLRRLGESGVMRFRLRYPESNLEYQSDITLDKWMQGVEDPDPLAGLGVTLFVPNSPALLEFVEPQSPAERGGFLAGDRLLKVDGVELHNAQDWIGVVRASVGKALTVELERAAETITLSVTPESIVENGVSYGRVGMTMAMPSIPDSMMRSSEYSVAGALVASLDKTWTTTGFVLLSVKKLLVGEISTKNLSGPVSIAKVAGSSAQGGLKSFVAFLALLSIFLGVFNLLPIPVLDGGHLLYYLIEAVKGSPVPEKIQMAGYQAGLFLIIGLSLLALYNDIMRL